MVGGELEIWLYVTCPNSPVGKFAEKADFECRINKNALLQTVFFWRFCSSGFLFLDKYYL